MNSSLSTYQLEMSSISTLRGLNNSSNQLMSVMGKGKIILTQHTVDAFIRENIGIFGGLEDDLYLLLTQGINYKAPIGPSFSDTVDLPGLPKGYLLYAELDTNGDIKMKMDSANIKALMDACEAFRIKANQRKLLQGMVLADIRSRFSATSENQIKFAAGASYETDRLDLSKMWNLIKSSHEMASSTKMLETIQSVLNLNMDQNDFFAFTEQAANAYTDFENVFSCYWQKPLKDFADLLLTLSVIGGLNKSDQVFDSAMNIIRAMDLSKPSTTPIYPKIMELLLQANHTRTYLDSKSTHYGMSAVPVANSTITTTVVSKCAKCAINIPHVVNAQGVVQRSHCSKCHFEILKAKRIADKEAKKNGKSTTDRKIPLKEKALVKTTGNIIYKGTLPKAASAVNFSGTNQNLALSSSHHFLVEGQHPESEFSDEESS